MLLYRALRARIVILRLIAESSTTSILHELLILDCSKGYLLLRSLLNNRPKPLFDPWSLLYRRFISVSQTHFMGRSTVNVHPLPLPSECTETLPWWRITIDFVTANKMRGKQQKWLWTNTISAQNCEYSFWSHTNHMCHNVSKIYKI